MNTNLHNARRIKNDEFYTQLNDIEKEVRHYTYHFKDQIVFCNCDDPRISNFFRYFTNKFEVLELKKLVTTCYKSDKLDLFSQNDIDEAVYMEYDGAQKNEGRLPDIDSIGVTNLKGNGDFRSEECIRLLDQSDIVCTNPPFSLFKEYVKQLIYHNKKFLIIGNYNAVAYKEIFPLIKENKMWLGVEPWGMTFNTPDGTETYSRMTKWFTNLSHTKRNEEIILTKKYKGNESNYPKYDNYEAIEVDKINNIPKDYAGIMGVPVTFLVDYNPNQFEIIGLIAGNTKGLAGIKSKNGKDGPYINGKLKYNRILITRRK